MEWSKAEIRQTERGVFEAELRGDHLISGDQGCFVVFTGWGPDEKSARENLKVAIAQARDENPEG